MAENWEQAWQPVLDRVGTDSGDGTIHWGADLVERGAVRRFLEPLEFDCALHYSEAVARDHGYPDIVAPYTSMFTFAAGPLWSPGTVAFPSAERNAPPRRLSVDPSEYPSTATGLFATDFEITFARPPVVGDRLGRSTRRLVGASLRETRVGRGAFLKFDTRLVDADEQTIATNRIGLFVYEPLGPSPGAVAAPGRPAPTRPVPEEWTTGPDAAELGRQRLGSDAVTGELLKPVDFPIPVLRLVMEAGVNRDFNLIHHNTEFAKAGGAPEMYANTLFLQSMWERTVRDYIGNAGTIKKIAGFRMGSFCTAGDTVRVRGRVEQIEPGATETTLDLRVWSENSSGVAVGPGTVTVGLPVAPGR